MLVFYICVDICNGFQSQDEAHVLHTSSPMCNRFLRFTSVVMASSTVDLFTFTSTVVGVERVSYCVQDARSDQLCY